MYIKQKFIFIIGFLLILSVLVFNQFTLEFIFSHDGTIDSNDKLFVIWLYDFLAIIVGIVIIYNRGEIKITPKIVFIIFIQIVVVFFMLEGSLRLYFAILHHFRPAEMTFDKQIGWQNNPYISRNDHRQLYGKINYSTQKYGFRIFGETNTHKTKILIIGDSFTMADNINDGYAYYDYLLKNNSNIEIFVYGGGGYGSLQEYMILDKYIDEINPNIILWQFCDNDFINNDHELESRSILHGGLDPRPYYIKDEIIVSTPWQRHGKLYDFFHNLYFVKLTLLEIRILEKDHLITIEKELTQDHPLYLNSYQTTENIMKLVKYRIGDIPLISFNAKIYDDFPNWWSEAFKKIANDNNFIFLTQITDSLTSARDSGIKIDYSPEDAHWNQTGHTIVGKILIEYLINNKLIKSNIKYL